MSENVGSNLKNKLVHVLNLFLSLKDSFTPKMEVEKKKKKKKSKKQKEDQLKVSVSNTSMSDDDSSNSLHHKITSVDELWEYMGEWIFSAYN